MTTLLLSLLVSDKVVSSYLARSSYESVSMTTVIHLTTSAYMCVHAYVRDEEHRLQRINTPC